MHWVVGLLIGTVLGSFVTGPFHRYALRKAGLGSAARPEVPGWLVGIVERTGFTVLVGLMGAIASAAVVPWLALKLATGWNHAENKGTEARERAFAALLAGFVSMFFAVVGGLVCHDGLTQAWLQPSVGASKLTAVTLTQIGFMLEVPGVLILFIRGPLTPSFDAGESLDVEDRTPLADGRAVTDRNADNAQAKRAHQREARIGLGLVGAGLLAQFAATLV